MNRPFAYLLGAYAAGVLAAFFAPLPSLPIFLITAVIIVAAAAWAYARPVLIMLSLFSLGMANLSWRVEEISPCDLRKLINDEPQLVTVRGVLTENPSVRITEMRTGSTNRSLAMVDVNNIRIKTEWQPAVGCIMTATRGLLSTQYFSGQSVEITGILKRPKGPMAPGLFDYRSYLKWLGIYYILETEGASDWSITPVAGTVPSPDYASRFIDWAQKILARGLPVEDESLRLLWAMTLGWKTALTGDVSEPFMQTGTMHIFAISGMHTALIALIMVHVLKALRISRRLCGWLVLPCLWFYTGATGWQSTAIRSAIMTTVIVVGWMLQRPGNLLNSLYASGFIILVWEPRQLFQASFQLSFFVVLSLALFGPFLEALRQRIFAPDPLLPDVLQKRKPAWLSGIAWFFSTSFISSLAAWLGSAPIIAYYFHLVTPVSLLANLIIVPLSTLALMCNSATLACGDWLPSIGELFNHSAWLWMKLMIVLSDVMAGWPGAYFYVRTPSLLEFSLYYFVLIALLCHWFQKYFLVSCPVLVVLIMSWCVQFFHAHRSIRITVLEAGGGDPILFNAPGKSDGLLVDCGSASSANFCIKPFLISQGINQLANVVLTHGDASQIGAFPVVHRHFKLQQLFISGVSFRSSPYRQILSEARDSGLPITAVHAGDFVGAWRVLHPTEGDRYSLADDATLVLKTKIHDVTLLLCSDLGPQGQRQLLEQPDSLHADVVIAGMPSKGEPLFDNLLSRINPQAIIICCSSFPVARTPRAALRQRLNESKTPVFYTSECGSVILQIQPGRCTIKTMSGEMLTISNKDRSPP